jgi:Flp pilus assembly protein TadD
MNTSSRLLLAISALLLAGGCATAPPPMQASADLFNDAGFKAPAQPIRADQLFALSAPMKAHLDSAEFRAQMRAAGPQQGLFNALYKKGELKLEYDATVTRDAGATFAAKKGNCLSLVIMTAAFAKALDIDFNFQTVQVEEQWSRSGSIYVSSTHVNLSLPIRSDASRTRTENSLTIDFLPPEDANYFHSQHIDEQTIVAMFLNNRAAEELAANRLDEAYWWARAAIDKAPAFVVPYNTLGVIYQRHGDLALAERVYKRALERDTEDTIVMNNLVPVLARLGKAEESKALAERLARIEPFPPFYYFQLGMKAMSAGRYSEAKSLFAREVKRSPYNHEFHFWLAIAHLRLGEPRAADAEMTLALDTSTNADATKVYSTKLAYLRAQSVDARKRAN